MTEINICLSDIPEESIILGKTGRKYVKLIVSDLRVPDQYGNDKTVYMAQSKEDRTLHTAKVYIGKGREIRYEPGGNSPF